MLMLLELSAVAAGQKDDCGLKVKDYVPWKSQNVVHFNVNVIAFLITSLKA